MASTFDFPKPVPGPPELPPEINHFQGWMRKNTVRRFPRLFGSNRGWAPKYYRPNPADANPLEPDHFAVFALIKTYNEEHMIEATVQNAFVQGADKVLILDNGSSDETIERAEGVGATLAKRVTSEAFDDNFLTALLQGVVAEETANADVRHVWWMHLDADEFPEGPGGATIKEYVGTLDQQFRLVGATVLNHLPTNKPEYISGFHPLDFQPFCYVLNRPRNCAFEHHKHNLQRQDWDNHFINNGNGSHNVFSVDQAVFFEPDGIVLHHCQYGEEDHTRAHLAEIVKRWEVIAGPEEVQRHIAVKHEVAEDIYAKRWNKIRVRPGGPTIADVDPRPWPDEPRRWYEVADVEAAKTRWRGERDGRAT